MYRRLWLSSLALGLLSLALFLFRIGTPSEYIFDEANYIPAARAFLHHQAQDLNPEHPPLAKMLMALGMKFAGESPAGWRFASAVCGSLTLVAIFLWTYVLLQDYGLALTAAALTLLNNFLFVMSRVAMLDAFFFAFVMWGVLGFTAAVMLDIQTSRRRALIIFSGLMFGLGGACKWTAVVTLAATVLIAAMLFIFRNRQLRGVGLPTLILGLIVAPIAAYCGAYWTLFHELHRPFSASEFIAMNSFIWRYHVNCPGNLIFHVAWYKWFFRAVPERRLSYLMGNWVVLWVGLPAVLFCAIQALKDSTNAIAEAMVSLLYFINLLQWLVIPQKLTCYYYYYPPAMFLGVALVIVLARARRWSFAGLRPRLVLVAAAAVFFLFCYQRMADLRPPFDCALGCWP